MSEVIVVLCTAGSVKELEEIAERLVTEKLVACANVMSPVRSYFFWEGKLCREEEALMIAKTSRALFDSVSARIKELHSYDLPEVIGLPVTSGLPQYLGWVLEEVRTGRPRNGRSVEDA